MSFNSNANIASSLKVLSGLQCLAKVIAAGYILILLELETPGVTYEKALNLKLKVTQLLKGHHHAALIYIL